ncbi:glutathione transferase GstA [Sorangium sp. So ce291]|uniref:glutathione transferase GstA n=1 Tax=Sorangium sp. So ce291 TaxID=3133294 RepID=UPI003F62F9A0
MKLYFSPGACSLSPHVVAREVGIELTLDKVDLASKKTSSGRDFSAINPKGYIPALELDGGEVLTEGPAIVQYLADQKPEAKLVPPPGTMARYRVQEMLGYINSELHKTYGRLFNPKTSPEQRQESEEYLRKRYGVIEAALAKGPYLFGEQFTVADAYLFTVTNWSNFVKLDLSAFPNLLAYQRRVAARPAVQEAMRAEGLPVEGGK